MKRFFLIFGTILNTYAQSEGKIIANELYRSKRETIEVLNKFCRTIILSIVDPNLSSFISIETFNRCWMILDSVIEFKIFDSVYR